MDETLACLIYNHIPRLGPVRGRLLISHFGSLAAALEASEASLAEIPGFGKKLISAFMGWREMKGWEKDFQLTKKLGVSLIDYQSPYYPRRLSQLDDAPLLLYLIGNPALLNAPSVAIIGTRSHSIYGGEMARKFSQELAQRGLVIVSGLARGIDTIAHIGALNKGKTLGVIGSGLANLYPRENQSLANQMVQLGGAVISEFPMEQPPDKQTFPQRNRIVSGMTLGTIVIEAPLKSGAMITANKAKIQERPLFVLPGRVDMETFAGNHALIKSRAGQLVEEPSEVANALDALLFSLPLGEKESLMEPEFSEEEKELLDNFTKIEISIEELTAATEYPISKLNTLLMSLVLKKTLKEYPGKIYKRIG